MVHCIALHCLFCLSSSLKPTEKGHACLLEIGEKRTNATNTSQPCLEPQDSRIFHDFLSWTNPKSSQHCTQNSLSQKRNSPCFCTWRKAVKTPKKRAIPCTVQQTLCRIFLSFWTQNCSQHSTADQPISLRQKTDFLGIFTRLKNSVQKKTSKDQTLLWLIPYFLTFFLSKPNSEWQPQTSKKTIAHSFSKRLHLYAFSKTCPKETPEKLSLALYFHHPLITLKQLVAIKRSHQPTSLISLKHHLTCISKNLSNSKEKALQTIPNSRSLPHFSVMRNQQQPQAKPTQQNFPF